MSAKGQILSTNLFPVVGVGASAGGLEAFRRLLKAIPEKSGMAYVLVQHLAPTHESQLAELLQKVTTIPVLEISDNVKVEPDHIYILPSNKMLVANDGVLELSPRVTKKNELNLPIDLFFTSLAEIHHGHAIGVVLSGTGSDGTLGLKAIRANEGITVAQEVASAAYDGMPQNAIDAGVVDFVLPPEAIPQKLLDAVNFIGGVGPDSPAAPKSETEVFNQMLSLLRIRRGTDFTYYKQTTIRRRILRRVAINKSETPADYLQYLRDNKPEQDALYQDLLIPVTSFFRDNPVFDTLCESIFPSIIKKNDDEAIRVWVAGCSTGEEAYSIAICFREYMGDRPDRVQIFASDLSAPAIAKARAGTYSPAEVEGVSSQRLQTFFTKVGIRYRINKPIRDMCVFTTHNFLKDPPFGRMDFISCRNVLIYMEPYLQKKALTAFHYALNPNAFLLLGKSETISGVPDLFGLTTKNSKLFTRKDAPGKFSQPIGGRSEPTLDPANTKFKPEQMRTDFQKTADDLILSRYTPAGVIVDEAGDIVHFRGNTSPYLEQSPGKPTHNLLLMAKNGLAFELRSLLHTVKKEKGPALKENISLEIDGRIRTISVEALPLPNTVESHYLLLFHDLNAADGQPPAGRPGKGARAGKKDDRDQRIRQLEQELAQTRENMRAITEDQEAVNEELQSANEELLSGSEEMQSLNEELETGKEELQSTNEELTVINQEMIELNQQVTTARDYAEGIIANIREPLLVMDRNMRVRTANAAFYKTFRVNERETEDMLIYDLGNRQWNIPGLQTLLEKILPEKSTVSDYEITHVFSSIGERVMLLNAREILGKNTTEKLILLSIEDVTEAVRAREKERQATERFQFIADAMPQKVWTADGAGNVDYYNQIWFTYTGLSFEELKGWGWKKIIHPDDWEENKKRWQHSIDTGDDFELEHRFLSAAGDYRWHLSRGLAHKDETGTVTLWIGTNTEIQEQKIQQEELERAVADRTHELRQANENLEKNNETLQKLNKELEAFTYVSSHDLQEPLRKIQTIAGRLLEKEGGNLTANGKDSFRRMQQSAERMQQLIQDLLAFSRLGHNEGPLEQTDLGRLVEEVVGELQETITDKGAVIDTTRLGSARVSAFQFRQLMQNLIGNALKFARPDVPPRITIESRLVPGRDVPTEKRIPETTYCHICIQDNGIGFDPKYSDKIFDVFQRLHSREEYTGTGIGLAIVRKIVDNHNGLITATGILNEGARFDLYIPA